MVREGFEATDLVDMTAALETIRWLKTAWEIEVAAEVEATVQRKGVRYRGVQMARSVIQVTSGPEDVLSP